MGNKNRVYQVVETGEQRLQAILDRDYRPILICLDRVLGSFRVVWSNVMKTLVINKAMNIFNDSIPLNYSNKDREQPQSPSGI